MTTTTITLWTGDTGLRSEVERSIAPTPVDHRMPTPSDQPTRADAVATKAALGRDVEMLAFRLQTGRIYVLPESHLALRSDVEAGKVSTIVGSDLGSAMRLVR